VSVPRLADVQRTCAALGPAPTGDALLRAAEHLSAFLHGAPRAELARASASPVMVPVAELRRLALHALLPGGGR